MSSPLDRDARLRLADVLSDEVMTTPGGDLMAEVAEDLGDRRALAKEFDRAFAQAVARTRMRRMSDRLKEFAAQTFLWSSWRPVVATAGALVIFLAAVLSLYPPYFQVEDQEGRFGATKPVKVVAATDHDSPPASKASTVKLSLAPPEKAGPTPVPVPVPVPVNDRHEADASQEHGPRLMKAVHSILEDAAEKRSEARRLPSVKDFIKKPVWIETREDRDQRVREQLHAVLGIVTDVPVVDLQKKIEGLRKNIRELDDGIVRLRERQLVAPKDGVLPGILTETVDTLGRDIEEAKKRVTLNRDEIKKTKAEVHEALKKVGVQLTTEQADPLLDGVLSGDLVRLVAVFNSAKLIDAQLARLLSASGENLGAARRYFAMHAALLALLVHAQDSLIFKIDRLYLPKLSAIEADIQEAGVKIAELLQAENREDQKRALETDRESQRLAEDAAKAYRRYLLQQHEQVAKARERTTHDLMIADNKVVIVEASFQLRDLMRDASASFEAIQKLEAPTFGQIFKNEELRREFESLSRKLDGPTI